MNISSILNGISIGKDTSGNFKLTPEGLAVRTTADGKFFVNKKDRLLDVSDLTFEGAENYIYRVPIQRDDVKAGDLIVTSENPFGVLFVHSVEKHGTLRGLDPGSRQEVEYVPPTNAIVDVQLYVKVVSLLDGLGVGTGSDTLLPLLLLGGQGGGASPDDNLTLLLVSQALGGKTPDNKLLPFLLLRGGSSGTLDNLLLVQALAGSGGPLSKLFGHETKSSKP